MQYLTRLALACVLAIGGFGCGSGTPEATGPGGSIPVTGPDPDTVFNDQTDNQGDEAEAAADTGGDDAEPAADDGGDGGGVSPDPEPEPEPEPESEPEPVPGDAGRGETLYKLNCQVCHGVGGAGGIATGIQHASTGLILDYIEGRDGHQRFDTPSGLTHQDVQDIAAFLASQ